MGATGANHPMTKDIYNKMKAELKSPADDQRVSKKYDFGHSTVRMVRNTKSWDEYCECRWRYHGHPKRTASVKKVQKVDREFIPTGTLSFEAEPIKEDKQENILAILLVGFIIALVAYIAILPFLTGAWSLK